LFGGNGIKVSTFEEYDVFFVPRSMDELGILKFSNEKHSYLFSIMGPHYDFIGEEKPTPELQSKIRDWVEKNDESLSVCVVYLAGVQKPPMFISK